MAKALEQTRDLLVLNQNLAPAVVRATLRRFREGPRQPSWSWAFECLYDLMVEVTPNQRDVSAGQLRQALDRTVILPTPSDIHITPVNASGVRCEWVDAPNSFAGRVVLFLHGGGYVSGSPRTHRPLIVEIARVASARIFAVDYRLAPEHPYPAALKDAWAAYWWLLNHGVRAHQIVVGGDSAGGGLTLALLFALRDAGMPRPAAAFCLSPWFDLTMSGPSLADNDETDYISQELLQASADMYLAGHDPTSPAVSPVFGDFHGLPPLHLQAGTAEVLLDDTQRVARAAASAGVEVELKLFADMIHVWQFLFDFVPQARAAVDQLGDFIQEHTAPNRTC